jgi:multidrug efflux pump subunit AcrB
MSIGKFSVSNPVLINILMITLLILGTFSVLRLPREQFAEVPFYWVNITVPYPGVSAEDIEQSVTVKVENELQGLDKLKAIQSVTREGSAAIRVEFDDGISDDEFKRLYQETQTQFGNVSLPDGTLDPIISDFSAADFLPVIEVVLSGDVEYSVLNETARLLKDRLAGIREISNIDTVGARDRQVLVEVDREKLEALGISINEVVNGVRARNVTIPGGTLDTESREYLLRTVGEVDKYAQLKEVIVRRSSGGQGTVYVGDIAGVEEGFEEKGIINRYNGRQAISLKVAKVSGGSSTRVIDAVKEEVAQFRRPPPGEWR